MASTHNDLKFFARVRQSVALRPAAVFRVFRTADGVWAVDYSTGGPDGFTFSEAANLTFGLKFILDDAALREMLGKEEAP